MNTEKSIEATKNGFEVSFAESKLYDRQTQDSDHLNRVIEALHIKPGDKILDLGTGTGYVALEIAREYPKSYVIGLDIVTDALKKNIQKAQEENLSNVEFVSYAGIDFPFEAKSFDIVVTRYALHHFPNIEYTFLEIKRILKEEGRVLVADPTPNIDDEHRFVDDFMKMKPDGHIKYYTKEEFEALGLAVGLELKDFFETKITFPRLKETADGYDDIMNKHNRDVIDGYNVRETNDHKYIYITQRVLNLIFEN